jgi:mRNA-degrading endonuclease RelE of RelBE toxin-antitoxin system
MIYAFEIKPGCKDAISKRCKRNRLLETALRKKISEIIENPHRYKHLRYDFKHEFRVQILKSFVLKYEIDEANKTIVFVQFGHHDEAYEH